MIEFATELDTHLQEFAGSWIGPGTDPVHYVKTFDDHLRDTELTDLPFVCIFVRDAESEDNTIGNDYDLKEYHVHIYYLDTRETWQEGKDKCRAIMGRLEKAIKKNRRLGNFESVDEDSTREYVFDTKVTSTQFDSSGQDEYYTFVCEMYLTVYTDTN